MWAACVAQAGGGEQVQEAVLAFAEECKRQYAALRAELGKCDSPGLACLSRIASCAGAVS